MFTVELVGAEELIVRLDAMPDTVRALVEAKAHGLAIALQTHVVRDKLDGQVLHRRSGALAGSIQEVVESTDNSVVARVFSAGNVKYAAIQEYGGTTPAHDIYPSKGEALAFVMGGKQVFAKVVHHPGSHIPERSFLRSALADMAADISMGLKNAVIEGMQRTVHG